MTKKQKPPTAAFCMAWSVAALLTAFGVPAQAQANCGLQAVELLARGDTTGLARLFADAGAVQASLQDVAQRVGALKGLEPVQAPRFSHYQRIVVLSSPLAPNVPEPYRGTWINAESDKLGPVQFYVGEAPVAGCRLVALSLDVSD